MWYEASPNMSEAGGPSLSCFDSICLFHNQHLTILESF